MGYVLSVLNVYNVRSLPDTKLIYFPNNYFKIITRAINFSFELIAHNLFIKNTKPNQVVKITDWFHLVIKLFI